MITELSQLDLNKLYTYADYLTWQFDERVELLKGRIFQMSPAPNTQHQRIVGELFGEIRTFLKQKPCEVFAAPFDVRLPISPDLEISKKYKKKAKQLPNNKIMTVVQPDICVICDENKIDEKGGIGAPELVIEILSKGNTKREMKDKFEIYQDAGVLEYWIVDPNNENVLVYHLTKGGFINKKPCYAGDVIKSEVLKGFTFEVNLIFPEEI